MPSGLSTASEAARRRQEERLLELDQILSAVAHHRTDPGQRGIADRDV